MKKVFLATGSILVLTVFTYILLELSNKQNQPTHPTIIPTPTIFRIATPSLAQDYEKEKKAQALYANERNKFLEERPWFLKLPLKSEKYFISYDPEESNFLITLYYYSTSSLPKSQQLDIAKQEAISVLISLGVDLEREGIIYTEIGK